MKFIIIVLCAVLAVVAADLKEEFRKNREDCLKSENVPQDVIEKLNNRQYDGDLGQEARCYIRCIGEKSGVWTDAAGYDVDKAYSHFQNSGLEVSMENLKKCITSNPDNEDKCTWAAKDLKCLWSNKYLTRKVKQ